MFKKYFNTNLKRFNLFNYLSIFLFAFGVVFCARFGVTQLYLDLSFSIYSFLSSIIFTIYSEKYFDKTYQLKKNAKKEITKENK